MSTGAAKRLHVIACGALARELLSVLTANRLDHVSVECLPALLHNRPEAIPGAVRGAILAARAASPCPHRILVGYADCGTGGQLDAVLAELDAERLPGPHCYAFYSGVAHFAAQAEEDMRAFFLTDFLARQFDTLVIEGLGLDRHPDLRDSYFGQYEKVVYLAQTDDPALRQAAARAAERLGLSLEIRAVGLGELESTLIRFAHAA